MSDSTRDLLVRGIAAAKAGDKKEAFFYLEWALRLEPPLHQKIDAWYWLSEVSTDLQMQREFLEKIVINDASDGRARRKLAILDGKLDPSELIDPDLISQSSNPDPRKSSIEGFTCSQCGGRMTYAADGQSLLCEYCESRHRLIKAAGSSGSVPESDFHVAMATKRGHVNPIWAHSVTCGGCGAALILEAGQVSDVCPYCLTPYALDQIHDVEIVPPDGILPFVLSEDQVVNCFATWFQSEMSGSVCEKSSIQMVYLPVWTFDLGGQVSWNCQIKKDRKWVQLNGQEIIYHNDMPIFATRHLLEVLHPALSSFDLSKMVDFDRRYLAGVKAENYQISAGDASLLARKIALDDQRQKILSKITSQVSQFRIDSTRIIVEAFRLAYIPACLVQYEIAGNNYLGLINGQTGDLQMQKPAASKKSFFRRLLG
jgi:uncharacterized CHY-type Zn-finger protein